MRAYGYIRIPVTKYEFHEDLIKKYHDQIKNYCAQNDIKLVITYINLNGYPNDSFEEKYSSFIRMISDLKDGKDCVDFVIVADSIHVGENLCEQSLLINKMRKCGVDLISLDSPDLLSFNLNDATEKLEELLYKGTQEYLEFKYGFSYERLLKIAEVMLDVIGERAANYDEAYEQLDFLTDSEIEKLGGGYILDIVKGDVEE